METTTPAAAPCPRCTKPVPCDAAFCPACGVALRALCTACGEGLPEGARFCSACGREFGRRKRKRVPERRIRSNESETLGMKIGLVAMAVMCVFFFGVTAVVTAGVVILLIGGMLAIGRGNRRRPVGREPLRIEPAPRARIACASPAPKPPSGSGAATT